VIGNFLDAFSGPGAIFMYAILAIFAYGVAICIERTYRYLFQWRVDERALRKEIQNNDLESAVGTAAHHPVVLLLESKSSTGHTWDSLAIAAPIVEAQVRKRVTSLAMVANVATMLGLLGTVYGLIYALEGLDQASAIERTSRLSTGIATAMLTTAWGLVVGVPALIAHNYISNTANRILGFCESISAEIMAHKQ
jgi:biopolymer transport protein ExbB